MTDKTNDNLIGTIGFHYLRKKEDDFIAEIGFDLAKPYWGKRWMSEAMREVLTCGFQDIRFTRVDATVELENEKSIQLMRKFGFSRKEELIDGLIYFCLTASNFPSK